MIIFEEHKTTITTKTVRNKQTKKQNTQECPLGEVDFTHKLSRFLKYIVNYIILAETDCSVQLIVTARVLTLN